MKMQLPPGTTAPHMPPIYAYEATTFTVEWIRHQSFSLSKEDIWTTFTYFKEQFDQIIEEYYQSHYSEATAPIGEEMTQDSFIRAGAILLAMQGLLPCPSCTMKLTPADVQQGFCSRCNTSFP